MASEAPITWEENCFLPLGYITLIQVQRTITPTTASTPKRVQGRKVGPEQKRFLLTRLLLSSRSLFIPVDALPLPFLLVHLTHQGWITSPSSRLIPCPESFAQTRCSHGNVVARIKLRFLLAMKKGTWQPTASAQRYIKRMGNWEKPSSGPRLWWLSSDLQGTGLLGLRRFCCRDRASRLKQLEGERVLLVHSSGRSIMAGRSRWQ